MVVTSLALSLASSLSPVVTSLPFYISEAASVYWRTVGISHPLGTSAIEPWPVQHHQHLVQMRSSCWENILQNNLRHHLRQPPSPQLEEQQPQPHPSARPPIETHREIKTHLIQDIIEQHIGMHDNTAPSMDIKNIYRSFNEVFIDGRHLAFDRVDEMDIWDLTSLHRAATPEVHLGYTHLVHNVVHGADVNQTFTSCSPQQNIRH